MVINNSLRPFDILPNFPAIKKETKRDNSWGNSYLPCVLLINKLRFFFDDYHIETSPLALQKEAH